MSAFLKMIRLVRNQLVRKAEADQFASIYSKVMGSPPVKQK